MAAIRRTLRALPQQRIQRVRSGKNLKTSSPSLLKPELIGEMG